MNRKRVLIISLLISCILLIGCSNGTPTEYKEDITSKPIQTAKVNQTCGPILTPTPMPKSTMEQTPEPTLEPTQEPSPEPVQSPEPVDEADEVIISPTQEVANRYEAFLAGNEPLYFNDYMHNDYDMALFETGKGYTISDLMPVFKDNYFNLEKNPIINYSYMDCGNDGIKELAVQFYGMSIYSPEDDSTLVYIIKEIDEKLELCYCYETWARSSSSMNQYGYYTSVGSNGATNHGWDSGYVDAGGKWNFIQYTEEEQDINQLSFDEQLGKVPEIAETKTYDGSIIVVTTNLDEIITSDDYYNVERCYTYFVDGAEMDGDLYSGGVYQEIFKEAGVTAYRPEEIDAMILEKETALGITEEIKQGKALVWEEWK